MIKDINNVIGKTTEQLQSEIELNYKLKKCLYIKININNNTFDCYVNKDNENIDNIDLYNFFKVRESYSIQLDSNKTMLSSGDTRMKLTSVNMFSYITKIDTIKKMSTKCNLTIKECLVKIVKEYLKNLNDNFPVFYKEMLKPLKLKKDKLEEVLNNNFKKELQWIECDERKSLISDIKDFLLNNLDKIMKTVNDFIQKEKVTEVRIYLDYPLESYKKEFELYLKSKAFNKNKYNKLQDGILYGIHNNNFTLNEDKPYLQNLTKDNTTPHLVTLDESIHTYYLFEYLLHVLDWFNDLKYDVNSNLAIGYENDNGNALIVEYDNIPFPKSNIFINCTVTNITHVKTKDKDLKQYNDINRLNNSNREDKDNLEWQFNLRLLSGKMIGRYISNNNLKVSQGEFTANMKAILYRYRQPLWSYFKYGEKFSYRQMRKIVYRLMRELFELEDTKKNPLYFRIMDGMNFGISFIDFYENNKDGGIVMKLKELSETMKRKINDKDNINEIESDEEYYYCIGKLIKFLLSKSKTENKTYTLARPFFKVKSNKIIKEKIKMLMEKYCNEISFGSYRVENVFKMVNSYEINDKISEDAQTILMVSIMDNMNEIYVKDDNKKSQNDVKGEE
ncbi:hypothetical protein ADU80_09605 [Clostridium botulinum]|uniref:CRISPR-associated protein Csh1 n=3 Tax=Clostridium botulinum TaxID=1491 RepID=A0A9Q1ZB19_CLOBO|nr:hypothetical protein [Clostridium botulinum]AEB77222.1 hypothetical protein CbC4_4021 [Clostridium botulinum BKT015925]KEH96426.1 hypothetical protein Y848_14240 [Clostridium botulinum C/D str. Sp77]KLU74326.1 hypothetical protein CBC3_p0022 [Clostridium botulinum V891]KOA73296.1 hypothetical protein ADU77_13710 [Clostridium botulinum]KOA74768.1 hypothetical protein ADU78_10005 [Clostridium botulinum]